MCESVLVSSVRACAGFGSVYMKLWSTLSAMCREPHPTLAQMANDICSYIANQVDSVGRDLERHSSSGSSSLPPSPNTRPAPHTMPHHGHRRGKSGLPHTISQDSVPIRDRDSTSSTSSQSSKKPIVTTQYVEWAAAHFTRGDSDASVVAGLAGGGGAAKHYQKMIVTIRYICYHKLHTSRYIYRNAALRTSRAARVETQAFHSRCPLPPAVVLFHPYEQHAAVASKDNFG
ncbi:unnamed protein product [Leptidea sinapis]|uniref:Uncharacterized protein n=1 Tax=Leptidea sinapis TaxID=189913 RepID=A0A5E4QD62_9NEOP|nr:unnamed protein product [Leptidea sinapis]